MGRFEKDFRKTFMVAFLTLVTSFIVTRVLIFSVRGRRKASATPRRHEE